MFPEDSWGFLSQEAFDELFADKIATTKIACAKARQALGWPARA